MLDGYSSDTYSLEMLDLASKHGVIMVCLPSHKTHNFQPFNFSFFKHFKLTKRWLLHHPIKLFSEFQIAGALTKACDRSANVALVPS